MSADLASRLGHLTDKFSLGYFPAYQRLAAQIGPAGRVLEAGVDRGGSMLMWQALFPQGIVAGIDHRDGAHWPPGTRRIVGGQDDPAVAGAAREASPGGWDLIVDDASHDGALSGATFALLWPQVRPGRWYVLEDWSVALVEPYASQFGDSMLRLAESFLPMLVPGGELESAEYRCGQAILRKRAA